MFCVTQHRMLASMSATDWSELGVSELPTGTVTLLLADVEGSTRLWQTQSDEMAAAVAQLDRTLSDVISGYDGVRPVEQGEGDSFVIAFARASDAVACALDLQRAPLAPKPEQMTAAVARLDRTLADAVATHGGVRPVEQGEGDSFVVAFGRAADAVACALRHRSRRQHHHHRIPQPAISYGGSDIGI
jgi:class 3 adenylate cyclase